MHLLDTTFSQSACFSSFRFAYSDDGSEDFDREESPLSLIKPGPIPPKETHSSTDAKAALVFNTTTNSHNGDIEEDKRE